MSGPQSGGTIVTISGTKLASSFEDYSARSSITFNSIPCTPLHTNFTAFRKVLCKTRTMPLGAYEIMVQHGSNQLSASIFTFMVLVPEVLSLNPKFGPISGGTKLIIIGSNLNIGSSAIVRIGRSLGPLCDLL